MEQVYLQELFSFQAALKQFNNTGAGLFQMEPTEEGAKTLASYDLQFKLQGDGFVVVAPCIKHADTGLLELKNQFTSGVKLSFAVFTKDQHIFEYAGLPEDPPGEYVYYLNNLSEVDPGTKLLLLNNRGISINQRVRLHTKQFSGTLIRDPQNRPLAPRVLDCRGAVIPETRYDLGINERENTYLLDLSRLPDGLFTIQYNGASTAYYCTKASFIRRIPLLIMEIFVDSNLPEKYRITKLVNGVQYIDAKDFGIHFGIYSYFWRYSIIPVNLCVWIKVATTNGAYQFTPQNARINNLNDPVIFTSTQAIDTPDNSVTVNLYQLNWNGQCRLATQKYKYCNLDYWIFYDNDYKCRYKSDDNNYHYLCPARCTDQLIGALPKPGEVATQYSKDANGNQYAQMTVYLVKDQCNNLTIKNKL